MNDFLEPSENGVFSKGKLSYAQWRLRTDMHRLVLHAFIIRQEKDGLTVEILAERINQTPEWVIKKLSNSRGWTLDNVSDLLLGMAMELAFTSKPFFQDERAGL